MNQNASHLRPESSQPSQSSRSGNRFLIWALIAVFFLMSPFLALGATVAATGTISVTVHDEHNNLWIPVPALLLDIAVFALPRLMPEEDLDTMRRELAPYRDSLNHLANEIEAIPAGSVILQVDSGREQVMITKDWRNFEIDIQGDDGRVHVSVPARLLGRMLDILDS